MDSQAVPFAATNDGERKQITAMFMDVVGFSDIASTADAEDLQDWLDGFYEHARKIITAHGGEVTEYLGDGVVALFGLARADELAASKAVSAGLVALKDITKGHRPDTAMQLRIGIASGEVAVRAGATQGRLPRATGMVTTLAQRVQEKANPGHVLIAQSTQDLLRSTIVTEPVPGVMLKGFSDPQTLYRAIRQQPIGGIPNQPFFVGRQAELEKIARSKRPCLVIGPAGMGKSAIVRQIAKDASAATAFMADGVHMRTIYRPFARWLWQLTGKTLPEFNDITEKFGTLDDGARHAIALVLGMPEGQRLLVEKSNVAIKAIIEESLWQAIQSVQSEGLLVFEDLHWLDNASIGVLVHILQSPAAANYKIIITSREDTKIGKYMSDHDITIIALNPLSEEDSGALLDMLSVTLSAATRDQSIIAKAAGVPLFLEQLTKRQAAPDTKESAVPGSLVDLLAQQIDATGAAKPVLQCAAVIGRTFALETLQGLVRDPDALKNHLQLAAERGVISRDDDGRWSFTHALLHQAAYQSLLRRTRVDYHGQVATYLQEHQADFVRRYPAIVTEHLSRAQQHVPAVQNYLAASQWAMLQGAFDDAEAHILAALSLSDQAPEDVDMRALKIACHTALGSVRMQTQGFTAEPVRKAFEKVAALAATQNSYSAANGPAFYGSFTHAIISGDKPAADQFSMMLRDAANTVSAEETDNALQLASLNVDTSLHFYTGDFSQSFTEFAVLREIYDVTKHGTMIASYGVDTFAAAQMFVCAGRAICGDSHLIPDLHAETDAHQKLLNVPVMRPWALIWGAVPLFYAGQIEQAVARVLEGIDVASAQSAVFWQVTGGAWLYVMDPSQSDSAEGLAGFERALKAHEMIGAHVGLPYFRAHYGQALARQGRMDAAYQASMQAVRENEENGLWCWYAEVLRLHARICMQADRADDAARYLEEAVSIASRQNARLWLLRARLDQVNAGLEDANVLRGVIDSFDSAATLPEITRAQEILAGT